MARFGNAERTLQVVTAGLTGPAIAKRLAALARRENAKVLAASRAKNGSEPHVTRFVNGRRDAAEETVVPPGPIVYEYDYGAEVAAWALEMAQVRSPELSGRYKRNWFVMVDGRRLPAGEKPPRGATWILTNDQPYARKIDVGAMQMRVPPHIVEDIRQFVQRRFGNSVRATATQIALPGGYVLKGRQRSAAKKYEKRRDKGRKTVAVDRRDTRAGQVLTYPALIVAPLQRF